MPRPLRIALLSEHRYVGREPAPDDWYFRNILHDDALLQEGLAAHDIAADRVDWADPSVDWSQYALAVFRTTWDYFERIGEFTSWLRRVERTMRLVNPAKTIWWNLDKHYLADLERRGVPIVPSLYIEAGDPRPLSEVLAASGWDEAVIKPCVSGAARHTYRVSAAGSNPNAHASTSADAVDAQIAAVRRDEAFLLQPFVQEITAEGEYTLVVIDSQVTHGVRKVPKAGDFRVQDDHGGRWEPIEPTPEQVAFAQRAIAACDPAPAYGRVDIVRGNDGAWQLMELELIEPELWLRTHPEAARRLADAIVQRLRPARSPS